MALASILTAGTQAETIKEGPVKAEILRVRAGLKNVFEKLRAGEPVTIAYFGGSITEGAGASGEEKSYRALMTHWFRTQFPQAKITEVNAAIGGTGSDLGVYRMQDDVLRLRPDLIFIEFAVNDQGRAKDSILKATEGIIRQAWQTDPQTDLCFIYTYQQGQQDDLARGIFPHAAGLHDQLAEHYGIPAISVALPVADLVSQGKMLPRPAQDPHGTDLPVPEGKRLFSNDGVHPGDDAMALYAETIQKGMPELEAAGKTGPHILRAPLTGDNWEGAKSVAIDAKMLSGPWREVPATSVDAKLAGRLEKLWETNTPGAALEFRFKGTAVKIYDVLGPAMGQVSVTLDGIKSEKPTPRFDAYSSYYRVATLEVGENLADGNHTVRIELDAGQPDRSSVTNQEKTKSGFDAKNYDGTFFRPGRILIRGELLP